jgi:hypothetical protein
MALPAIQQAALHVPAIQQAALRVQKDYYIHLTAYNASLWPYCA